MLKTTNAKVTSLNLSGNLLDDRSMTSLGEYIESNPYLKYLRLTGNSKITNAGVDILSGYIVGNITMTYLSLVSIKNLTDACFPYLEDIAKSSHLHELYIFDTNIPKDLQRKIEQLILIPTSERQIPIKSKTKSASKTS